MLANSAWPTFYLAAGFAHALPYVLASLLIEAAALRVTPLRPRKQPNQPLATPGWRRALWLALLANLVSAAFGLTCFVWVPPFIMIPSELIALIVHFVFTLAIELIVYSYFVRPVGKFLVSAVVVANLLTYFLVWLAHRIHWIPTIPAIDGR